MMRIGPRILIGRFLCIQECDTLSVGKSALRLGTYRNNGGYT